MSEVKFTKGEWSVSYGLVVIGDVHYDIENNDDAHLIAAAPEMYKALIQIQIEGGLSVARHKSITKLLAKARGESC